jgi:pilus assembly protein CpaE
MSDNLVRLDIPKPDVIDLEGLSVLCIGDSTEARLALEQSFAEVTGLSASFAAAGAVLTSGPQPDLIFLHAMTEDEASKSIKALRSAPNSFERLLVVMMPATTRSATVRLVEAGADDFIPVSPSIADVLPTLARAKTARRVFLTSDSIREPGGSGKTIIFLHASGGAGATTLAVNSAILLQQQAARNAGTACLIDLDLQFGDAHLQLDLSTQSHLAELISAPRRLDQRMLQQLMVDGPNGLKVLTVDQSPLPLDAISSETVESVLALARRQHRYVVVDMPVALVDWTATALRMADHIFLVTQLTVGGVRSTKRLLEMMLENSIDASRISVVANRCGGKTGAPGLTLAQASKAIGLEVGLAIPNDYAPVIESLDQGSPLAISRPTSKVARAIADALGSKVTGDAGAKRSTGNIFGLSLQGKR